MFLLPLHPFAKNDPERIKNMIRDNDDGTYTVTFKERVLSDPPTYMDVPITVNADFPGGLNGTQHAQPGDTAAYGKKEVWPLILEKAYAWTIHLRAANPG
jgi:hypothetical protein